LLEALDPRMQEIDLLLVVLVHLENQVPLAENLLKKAPIGH
jgi:hypothetical protein